MRTREWGNILKEVPGVVVLVIGMIAAIFVGSILEEGPDPENQGMEPDPNYPHG